MRLRNKVMEKMTFISKNKGIISLSLIAIIFFWFYVPLLKDIDLPVEDDDYFRSYYRLGLLRKIVFEYRQFPLRNPFLSGGFPIWGDPNIFALNPFYIFVILFGEVAGIRLVIFFLLLFCAGGMFYLTRYVLKYDYLGSVFSSLVFILCGWGIRQIENGNYAQIYYYLLPWALAFFIKSTSEKRFMIFTGLFLSLILLEAVLIVIPVILFLFIYACLQFKMSLKNGKPIIDISYVKSLSLILLFTFFLSAIKIIPLIDALRMRPENYIHFDGEHSYAFSSHVSRFYGYAMDFPRLFKVLLNGSCDELGGMYLGIIPCGFFLLSSIVFFRKNWRYLVLLGIFIIISFGSNSPVDLFKLIWSAHPFMHSVYKLHKYFGFFIFFPISLIGGRIFSLHAYNSKFQFNIKLILFFFAAAGIIIMYITNQKMLTFQYMRDFKVEESSSFFQVRVKKYRITAPFHDAMEDIDPEKISRFYWLSMLQGFGVANNILGANSLDIRENIVPKHLIDNKSYNERIQSKSSDPMKGREINPLYRGEVFFLKSDNSADFHYFSPNTLEITVRIGNAPDILIINQRYDAGWRCDWGKLTNWNGLLGIELKEPGEHSVRLKYAPIPFLLGLGISISAIFCMCCYWRKHNQSSRSGALSLIKYG